MLKKKEMFNKCPISKQLKLKLHSERRKLENEVKIKSKQERKSSA